MTTRQIVFNDTFPHPRAVYPDVSVLLQSGFWHGTPEQLLEHDLHQHTDFWPGLYIHGLQAFVLYGRPLYEGHLFTVSEYFGAFDREAYDNDLGQEHESLYHNRIDDFDIDALDDPGDTIGPGPQ